MSSVVGVLRASMKPLWVWPAYEFIFYANNYPKMDACVYVIMCADVNSNDLQCLFAIFISDN